MPKRSKESGMIRLLKALGVPLDNPTKDFAPGKYTPIVKEFLLGNTNLVVIGKGQYLFCAKLIRMKFSMNLAANIGWYSQSALPPIWELPEHNLMAVVNIMPQTEEGKMSKFGGILGKAINNGTQIVLGVRSADILNDALGSDADTVEETFEVWKIGSDEDDGCET